MTADDFRKAPAPGDLARGLRENLGQVLHQLLQVLLVGLTLGLIRTVVPALAETEFGDIALATVFDQMVELVLTGLASLVPDPGN